MRVTRQADKTANKSKVVSFDTISAVQTHFQSNGWKWTEERDQQLQKKGYVKYYGVIYAWNGYGYEYR